MNLLFEIDRSLEQLLRPRVAVARHCEKWSDVAILGILTVAAAFCQ